MPKQFEVGVETKVFLSPAWFSLYISICGEKSKASSWAILINASCYHVGRCLLAPCQEESHFLSRLHLLYHEGVNIKSGRLSSPNYLTPFLNCFRKCKREKLVFLGSMSPFFSFLGNLIIKGGGGIQYLLISFSLWVTADDHLGTISQK